MPAFVELLQSQKLNEELNQVQLHVKNVLLCVHQSSPPVARTIME